MFHSDNPDIKSKKNSSIYFEKKLQDKCLLLKKKKKINLIFCKFSKGLIIRIMLIAIEMAWLENIISNLRITFLQPSWNVFKEITNSRISLGTSLKNDFILSNIILYRFCYLHIIRLAIITFLLLYKKFNSQDKKRRNDTEYFCVYIFILCLFIYYYYYYHHI